MIQRFIVIIVAILMLQSCRTVHKTAEAQGEVAEQGMVSFKNNYTQKLPLFNHLQIKSRLDATLNGKSQNATLRLYIDRDKLIWANVSLLGITGARAKITPDRVQAYEIIDKTYINDDFNFINQKLKVNFIDFQKFQQLLLGQLFLIDSWDAYALDTTPDNHYALAYKDNAKLSKKPQPNKYIHTFYLDSDYRLTQVDIRDSSTNTQVLVTYDNWQRIEGKDIPGAVKIMVKGKDTDVITLDYNNFEFSEMSPPFRIPDNYKERKLK